MSQPTRVGGFGARLFVVQSLVILGGTASLLGVALTIAPILFRERLERAIEPLPDDVAGSVGLAFEQSILISLSVAVTVASAIGLLVGWLVSRRVQRSVLAMAESAESIAASDYRVRIPAAGLGSEFTRLEDSFNDMAAALAATERTRVETLRDLAHEFRTPLTTVRGYTEALADGVMTADADVWRTVASELARMERLVRDIALVSNAQERQLHLALKRVPVAELVVDAIATAEPGFAAKQVALTVEAHDAGLKVLVDLDRMHEVLANLLDNALRHTPAGGEVHLAARPVRDHVELAVSDTGEGIAAVHLSRVFERLYRVDDGRSRDHGGTGIGLAIARALVEAHDGRIRAESPGPGQGSTFRVTLPRAQ